MGVHTLSNPEPVQTGNFSASNQGFEGARL